MRSGRWSTDHTKIFPFSLINQFLHIDSDKMNTLLDSNNHELCTQTDINARGKLQRFVQFLALKNPCTCRTEGLLISV